MGLSLQTEVLGEPGTSSRWARGGNPDCREGLASGDKKMVPSSYSKCAHWFFVTCKYTF